MTTQLTTLPAPRAPARLLDDPLLLETEVAAELRVALKTLRNWRGLAKGPPYIKIEGAVRYRRSAIEAYKREMTVYPERTATP